MEMDIDETDKECNWDLCPKEILIEVFKSLEPIDLLTCMRVNKMWRTIADYCGQTFDKWTLLVKNNMHNRGATFRQKSILSNRHLYLNSRMWSCMQNAEVKLKHVYNLKDVKNIHVYKDYLIVVCNHAVKYFTLENGKIQKEYEGSYLDYRETDFLVAKLTEQEGEKHMLLYSKRHKIYESFGFKLPIYSIQDNKCFLTSSKNCAIFYECRPESVKTRTLGRYYSDPRLLAARFIYKDDMYLFVKNGNVFRYQNGDSHLKKYCTLEVPDPARNLVPNPPETFLTMFHKCSVVYGVQSKEKEGLMKTRDSYCVDHRTVLYADATCALEHGNILILGFKKGKVGIVNTKKFWTTDDLTLDFEFYVQDVVKVQDVEPIKWLDVYEGEHYHYVFVTTASNLYQFLIHQPDYKKVML